jgi:hypothetical protein
VVLQQNHFLKILAISFFQKTGTFGQKNTSTFCKISPKKKKKHSFGVGATKVACYGHC